MNCKWKCWKCWLGYHDWEILDYISHNELFAQVYEQTHGKRPGYENRNEIRSYQKRVCLRCKKYEDEITNARSCMLKDYEEKQIRKAQRDLIVEQITEDLRYRTRNEKAPHARFNRDESLEKCYACSSTDLRVKNGSDVLVCQKCMQRHEPF